MNLKFEKIVIHNFLSVGDAEINFNDCGYVKVQGRNECIDDNSASNGSGKSSIFEAIIYAITGQTIRGTKDVTNLKGDDGCYVGLEFFVDGVQYKILRSKDHKKYKTDLKIYINGEDKSGKGIQDGNKLLLEYLPTITFDLISSVIVLGQGLPQRFTNNKPAERKRILEQLSESDIMIEDLKARVAKRALELHNQIRENEDDTLKLNSQIVVHQKQIETSKAQLATIDEEKTAKELADLSTVVASIRKTIDELNLKANDYGTKLNAKKDEATALAENLNKKLTETRAKFLTDTDISNKYPTLSDIEKKYPTVAEITAKYPTSNDINAKYSTSLTDASAAITKITADIQVLEKDITSKENVKDTCPTCGQKLPNVQKFDTTHLREELETLKANKPTLEKTYKDIYDSCNKEISDNNTAISNETEKVRQAIKKEFEESEAKRLEECRINRENLSAAEQKVNEEFAEAKERIKQEYTQLSNEFNQFKTRFDNEKKEFDNLNQNLIKLTAYKETLATQKATLEATIKDTQKIIDDFSEKILYNNNEKDKLNAHLAVNAKFDTELKRDFRTHLLTNVIDFISEKAKEYSKEVFDTDKIMFKIDGNNIEIGYNDKEYSCLSGGEKQKVDLIVQFAIRDMLCTFRNFSSNLLIVDEIFDNLDSKGCEKVMDLMSTRLSDISSIFIVTHHTDIEIPYDAQITVVKSKEGISYVE